MQNSLNKKLFLVSILILILIISCIQQKEQESQIQNQQAIGVVNMKLVSSAFQHNSMMPSEFTCDGSDSSPPLSITDVPANAKSLVLIVDDPDAPVGTWDHWVVFNIPQSTKQIPQDTEPNGVSGKNSWGKTGYGGPCPPSGTHRYFFKLYALDTILNLAQGATKKQIEAAMQKHILAKAELVGLYKRVGR